MLRKLFEISCKRATFLASKKEEGKTSFLENLKLKLHYKICDGCKLFERQTTLIGKNVKRTHDHINNELRPEKKREIKDIINTTKIIFLLLTSAA